MDTDDPTTAYVLRFAEAEDEPLRAARARSEEADIPAVAPETGALLRFFARLVAARHVVEVGSGGGYSGLWLLGGMQARGSLTTIEIDPGNQSLAQQAFAEARCSDRVRSMLGPALSVLPKLADANYDIVFLDAVKAEYVEYLEHAKRLLRPGGLLLADNTLWHGKVVDPEVSDIDTDGIRDFNDAVREDPSFTAMLCNVGDGVLAAVNSPLAG
ncbi:MAG: O-methyltransferase [Egibacteraceae bacterium]